MTQKPSYEELEQIVKALEKEVVQLKLVEEQLKIAIDRSPTPTATGGSDGSIIAYNEALENLIGYKRSEIKDVTVWAKKLYPDEKYRDFVWKNINRALEGKEQDCTEFTITCNDGSTKVVDFKTSFFQGGLIIQMIDITERKQSEEALRESEERLTAFMASATDGFILFDSELNHIEMNKVALEITGLERKDVIGKNIIDTVPNIKETGRYDEYKKVMKTGAPFHIPDLILHPLADDKHVELKAFKVGDGLGIIFTDITGRKQAEEELQKLASVVKYSSELINLATLDGKMIFLNKAGSKMLGIDSDKVEQVHIMEVIPDDLQELVQTELLPALMKGDTWEGELKYRNIKTGEVRDVHAITFTVKEPNTQKPLFLANVSIDITERKQSEEALRESEERFRYLTESSPLSVFQTDKDGSVLYLNNKWLAITGMSLQDALGFGWAQALHSEDQPRILAEWARCLEEKRGYDGEFRFVRPFGEIRWVHTRTSPVFSPAGDIISHVGVNEDITERKQAEKALRQEEEKFRVLVEESPLGISFICKDAKYKYINPKFIEIFGYTLEDIPTGKEWFKKAYPNSEYRDQVISTWIKDLKDSKVGESRPRIFKVTCKNGEEKIVHFKPVTMATGDQFVFYEDITNQQRLEDQLRQSQKTQAIGTLAGGIAHDFNNMLSPIILHTEMVLADISEKSHLRFSLEEILKASLRAKDLVKQILTFSRQAEQERIPLIINPVIKEAL